MSAQSRESWRSRWSRRSLTIPLYVVAFVLLASTLPLWLPLLALVDVARGDRRVPKLRATAFFLAYLVCELAGIALSAGSWGIRLGGRVGGAAAFVDANAELQRRWTGALFACATRLLGFRVELDPLSVEVSRGPFLLFVRHTSTADTILAAQLIANRHAILLRYVLKRELLWDPCLDIVGQRLPNSFVARGSARRDAEIAAVAALGRGLGALDGALIYPEGTRFSPDKLVASRERLRREGRGDLATLADGFAHVLPPRLGGPLALLDAAPGVDVVVLEHVGFEGAASFATLWSGQLVGRTVHARLRRIPARDIPSADRDRWLFEVWRETDRWVGSHQGTGA